jgi:hypothetical protein
MGSAPPPVTEAASLIAKKINEHRTSNVQHRTSNECILSIVINAKQHTAQTPALFERINPPKLVRLGGFSAFSHVFHVIFWF